MPDFPLLQPDSSYGNSVRDAKCRKAIEDCSPNFDLCDLSVEVSRGSHQFLAQVPHTKNLVIYKFFNALGQLWAAFWRTNLQRRTVLKTSLGAALALILAQ